MSISHRIFERRASVAVALLALASLHDIAGAQSILDFDEWMQKIDRRSQSMQRNLARKDAAAASADAHDIGELYGYMEAYFTRRGDSGNAVKLSREGRDLAATVVQSVAGNDFAGATQAAQTIGRACRTCHLQYKPLE
jgi:cytochrome c556